jgi:hypothetical protein
MKKSILNIGKALEKADQKEINGGIVGCKVLPWCDGDDRYEIIGCICYLIPL